MRNCCLKAAAARGGLRWYPSLPGLRAGARQQPVTKSVFPDVDFAPIAESFGFEAATIRTLEDLHKLTAKLRKPDGPIFLDCKINADVAAPFMIEFAQCEGRHYVWRGLCCRLT